MSPSLIDGRYLPLGTLGRGGMASVLRAFDRVHERVVALKIPSDAGPGDGAHPLAEEYAAWAPIDHPHVVRALDYAVQVEGPLAPGRPYLVLEHVPGAPVHRVLPAGRVGAPSLERVGVMALRALDGVHAAGLIHRDLKPGNLLARRRSGGRLELKLTDFGLAAPLGSREPAGTISGSLPFVAPEAILGEPLDARADLYGLGIALFHLATGSLPCRSDDPATVLRWHLTGRDRDPRRLRPALPERLARLIRSLIAACPEDRPRSAGDALASLGLERGTGTAPGALPPEHRGLRYRLRLALDAAREGCDRLLIVPDDEVGTARTRELIARAGLIGVVVHQIRCGGAGRSRIDRVLRELILEEDDRCRPDDAPELGAVDALGRQPDCTMPAAERARRLAHALARAGRRRSRLVVAWEGASVARDPSVELVNALAARLRRSSRGTGGLLLVRVRRSATARGSSTRAG